MATHTHSHSSHSGHDHAPANFNRAFAIGISLNVIFVAVEFAFGLYANSLALLADAGHNLSDVICLLLAWGAAAMANSKPTVQRTYGLRRTTILASLFSSILLMLTVGGIAWEALQRISSPNPIDGKIVILVAGIGLVINGITALLFASGRKHDLNIKAAYLHMTADAAISFGVVVVGALILWTDQLWLDPAVSLAIAVIILIGTWGLLKDSLDLAVDAVPAGIDPQLVREYLKSRPGVSAVHDLHIWGMSTTETALTAHLIIPDGEGDDQFLKETAAELAKRFSISHPTLQIERNPDGEACEQTCHDPV